MSLDSIYQKIWELTRPFLAQGRFYDLWHTEISIDHMQQILRDENKQDFEEILIPSIILHDIGWSRLDENKNINWEKADMRIQHMKEGAIIAKQILDKLKYKPKLVESIVNLVANHDNIYLGIEPQSDLEKLLRDADACFILTELSFWKDYNVQNKGESPYEFLENQVKKYGQRYTKSAQKITDQQIIERRLEIADESVSPHKRFEDLKAIAEEKNKLGLVNSQEQL